MASNEPHARPMAIPEPSQDAQRTRSGSLSALLSSFSPRSPTSASNAAFSSSMSRDRSPSAASSYSEANEPATPRDNSPLSPDRGYQPYALREGVFGTKDSNTKVINEEPEDPSDYGFLGSRSAAYHAHARRASWSSRGPASAPAPGAEFGTSPPPPSLMGWVQTLGSTSPRTKAAPLPPLDTNAPQQDPGSTPPANSNLGMLFRRMSVGSGATPQASVEAAPKPFENAPLETERGRESVARRKTVPRRLSPTSERMLRGAYNDLS